MRKAVLRSFQFIAWLCAFWSPVQAITLSDPLPVAPEVKVGKLANGLTYYIHRNAKPMQKAELRLVVKAGSILEDDDQLGLAHFVEHMAFNGSTHFKKNELVSYLQSIGVKFGADLNAYTTADETVYILPIPIEGKDSLDTGLMVLQDWAQGLSMNDADIDQERGVVLEELRLGKGAGDRLLRAMLPKLLKGSRYADRLPIGSEVVLKNFSFDAIRRFYRDWYRPNLMAVVVVGDVDPAVAESLIQARFSGLVNPVPERPRQYVTTPPEITSEAVIISDPEVPNTVLSVHYPAQKKRVVTTVADYRANLIDTLGMTMLAERTQALTQRTSPPFLGSQNTISPVVPGYQAFASMAVLGQGGVYPAIEAVAQETARARKFGFTKAELERSKKNMLRAYVRLNAQARNTSSSQYAGEYIRNFLVQEGIPGAANEYLYASELIPQVSLDEVNQAASAAIPGESPRLVFYLGPEKSGTPIPSSAELMAAFQAADGSVLNLPVEKLLAAKLMEPLPAEGLIVSETVNKRLGLHELVLGNGLKVVLKTTKFQNDQVLLSARRFGGQSLVSDADIFNARYASAIVQDLGVKDFTPSDLQKMLSGNTARVQLEMGDLSETVSGEAGAADVETLLQLVYLNFTDIRKDEALFASFISKQQHLAKNMLVLPEVAFGDLRQATLFNSHPRATRAAQPSDFNQVNLDRVLDIYKGRFSSAKGFTFYLVGNFDFEQIKPLIATYLGNLPVADLKLMYQDVGIRPVRGVVKKALYQGKEPKSSVHLTFSGEAPYSGGESLKLLALQEVLNIKFIETLREKLSLIYGGGMNAELTKFPYAHYSIGINFPCAPENVEKVIAAVFAEIKEIKDHGPLADDLNKVKANLTADYKKKMKENGYWLTRLQSANTLGTDPTSILTYEARINAVTQQELQDAVRRYFNTDNYMQLVLYPEK